MNQPGPAPIITQARTLREVAAVVAAVLVGYLLLRISPLLTLGALSDDGIYLALGKALADGEGYRSMYAAGDAVHAKYPPGLPTVHALLWSLSDSLTQVHHWALLLSAMVTSLAAGILWWVGRRRFGLGVVGLTAFVVGPLFLESSIQYLNLAISEPWFLLGWGVALALFPSVVAGSGFAAISLGTVVGVTALFRSQGLVSVPTFIFAVWLVGNGGRARRLRTAWVTVGALVPLLTWRLARRAMLLRGPAPTQPDELGYDSWFPTGGWNERIDYFVDAVRYNLDGYSTFIPDQIARPAWLGAVLLTGLLTIAFVGAVRSRKVAPDLVLSLAAQVLLVLAWPFAQDRFLVPLLPLLGMTALLAARQVTPGRQRWGWAMCALVVLLVGVRQARIRAGTFVPNDTSVLYHPSRFLVANSISLLTAGQWIERRASPDDVVLTPFAPSLFLYTGRKVVNAEPAQPDVGPTVFDRPGEYLARRAVEDGVTLLILMGSVFDIVRDAAEVQQRCPQALQFLEAIESPAQISVYRILVDDCLRELGSG